MAEKIVPPFTLESATQKVQRAEDLWNGKNPQRISLAYTEGSTWRNRNEFVQGREEIEGLLTRKWKRELDTLFFKCTHDFQIDFLGCFSKFRHFTSQVTKGDADVK